MGIGQKITDGRLASDWQLRNGGTFNMVLVFRKRNIHCVVEMEINCEDKYVSLTVASFEAGRAEYIIYFEDVGQATRTIAKIEQFAERLSVANSITLAEKLCGFFQTTSIFSMETRNNS